MAHETGTGSEIREQSGGTVTAFCNLAGSGGALGGVARALAPKGVRCHAVEPEDAEATAAAALLPGAERGGTVAFVVCDSGLKYFSTDLWED